MILVSNGGIILSRNTSITWWCNTITQYWYLYHIVVKYNHSIFLSPGYIMLSHNIGLPWWYNTCPQSHSGQWSRYWNLPPFTELILNINIQYSNGRRNSQPFAFYKSWNRGWCGHWWANYSRIYFIFSVEIPVITY